MSNSVFPPKRNPNYTIPTAAIPIASFNGDANEMYGMVFANISVYPRIDKIANLSLKAICRVCNEEGHCTKLQIPDIIPLRWGLPIYGYALPPTVILSTTINIFMLTILFHKHLRNATNYILISISINDLFTGLTSSSWAIYYYSMGMYLQDFGEHHYRVHSANLEDSLVIPEYLKCVGFIWLFKFLPLFFHSSASWVTVYLAIQRYLYISEPSMVTKYCSKRITFIVLFGIYAMCFLSICPEIFGRYIVTVTITFENHTEVDNFLFYTPFVYDFITIEMFTKINFWIRSFFHLVPCILLTFFTAKLAICMKRAEQKKMSIVGQSSRKYSTVVCGGRKINSTNKLLFLVCGWFLLLEFPAFVIHLGNFLLRIEVMKFEAWPDVVNRIIPLRNLSLLLSAPAQFAIYCWMSAQFRLTAKQIFTKEELYTVNVQNTPDGRRRYNMVIKHIPKPEEDVEAKPRFWRRCCKKKQVQEVEMVPIRNNRKNGKVEKPAETTVPLQTEEEEIVVEEEIMVEDEIVIEEEAMC
ncbi:unnamed protein product [Caenorhabditis angaria]|uniref:G-protein coupled receptors family 1 profile domain-containing protein n=1 Tax=Caenorhabditis angaria TaxID=860376 RepID=A0A9P1J397_9PELO|nr:unnamed protein product [Caenorhabditis angaria]